VAGTAASASRPPLAGSEPLFRISLAQRSLFQATFGAVVLGFERGDLRRFVEELAAGTRTLVGKAAPSDLAKVARREFGLGAVEYVNWFYFHRAGDLGYFKGMASIADGEGVTSLLMMCGMEGNLGAPGKSARTQAIENHTKWLEPAKILGCHSTRVTARSDSSLVPEEQQRLVADGLRALCELADDFGLNVLVENHGGIEDTASSMRAADTEPSASMRAFERQERYWSE